MATEAEIAIKNAHIQEMVYELKDLLHVIDKDRNIWYGGYPQSISNLESFVESTIARLVETFPGVLNEDRQVE